MNLIPCSFTFLMHITDDVKHRNTLTSAIQLFATIKTLKTRNHLCYGGDTSWAAGSEALHDEIDDSRR